MPTGFLLWIPILAVSIILLVKSSDLFVEAAKKVGLALGFSPFIVGIIIVSVGTSLPELVSSIIAVLGGASEIVVGNALGSNITNILLILGITSIVSKKFTIKQNIISVDIPFLVGSAVIMAFMLWDQNFTIGEAIICIFIFTIYMINSLKTKNDADKNDSSTKVSVVKEWFILLGSSAGIYFGAKYTVESVVAISQLLSMGTEVLALSAIALGTSLPELTVSLSAVRKGHAEMAIGNIIGSNIFNTFVVIAIPAFIGKLTIPDEIITFSLPFSVAVSFLALIVTLDLKVDRWEGWLLFTFYIFFILKLFALV